MENKNYVIYYYEDSIADLYSNILIKHIIAKNGKDALKIADKWCNENEYTLKEIHLMIYNVNRSLP